MIRDILTVEALRAGYGDEDVSAVLRLNRRNG